MDKNNASKVVGVIGAGSFGTAISKLLAENTDVLLYARKPDLVETINEEHVHLGTNLPARIKATDSIEEITRCDLLFAIVPSVNFREMIQDFAPYLKPWHIMIHGTKGFDTTNDSSAGGQLTRADVHTMSEVILQETLIRRVGCLSGPNLSSEIMEGQPTATLIGSRYREVVKQGMWVLRSNRFQVFGSHDILGAELAGALKNAIAIGSGILAGLGMGKNIQALLITRGLGEMVYFGKAMGADGKAFMGTAGIGDLIATATSEHSRNFSFGKRLAQGESLEQIQQTMPELAEGVRTIKIMAQLGRYYNLRAPITNMLFKVVFEGFSPLEALDYLIKFPYDVDVDFL